MKYVVSGYIGFDNFGDEVIALILSQKLKREGADKITFISSNPKKTSELYDVDSCGMLNFLPSIINTDVLISGGGSLLQDATSIKSLIYYLAVIFTALFFGKEVQIFAQGIGPINSKLGKLLTKIALKKAKKISVRDSKSQELLKSWGIESELVKDPVLELELIEKHQTGTAGIQLRKFDGVNKEFLEKLAEEVIKKFSDKKIEVISLQDRMDREVCENFVQILKDKGFENVKLMANLSINEAIDVISNLEYLVAMRFHANVVGIKSGVKTLSINYDPKVEKLAKEYKLPMINLDDKDFSDEFARLIC